jgi:hypothetical protein
VVDTGWQGKRVGNCMASARKMSEPRLKPITSGIGLPKLGKLVKLVVCWIVSNRRSCAPPLKKTLTTSQQEAVRGARQGGVNFMLQQRKLNK